MNLPEITEKAILVVREAGDFLKSESGRFTAGDVEEKGMHNLVTYVDRESEKRIVEGLSAIIPEAGFIVEENQELQEAGHLNWIIDPLDGTTNYIHHIPVYSISVALQRDGEFIMGIVYEPVRDECFFTWEGAPSYLNGNKISVSKTRKLDQSLLATGFPYHDYALMDRYLALFDQLMRSSRGIRRLGSAAIDLAYVACGRFEVFYEYGLHIWDIAAGALIVKNAGGRVTDFKGERYFNKKRQIIATNGKTHIEFLQFVNTYFKPGR
ncbi:MAG: inositol monophosphatase family protein [bacterium]|jgi:myo-inositol-1(or 4)-monophosphatase